MTQINRDPLLDNKIAIFIDSNVDNYQQLIQGTITPASVFILDSNRDGVEQISQILTQNPRFTEAHIVSHGAPGCLYLGNTNLSLDTLDDYTSQLQPWRAIDTLLLYGCNVAAGDAGAEFIERLYHITEAKIAASAQRTGSSVLGGDWNLEITTAELDVAIAFSEEVQKRYAGVLATIEVTTLDDDGAGSLREALATINGNSDASNTITFAGGLSGTINLASELSIANDVVIEGSGVTISGGGNTRVFRVDSDGDDNNNTNSINVTLRNLTITGGATGSGIGAGILNDENLTLENTTVDGNVSGSHAGGIGSFGNLTLRNSTVSNNQANNGNGGGIAINTGNLVVENSTISGNTASRNGSGIDTRANTATINNSTIAFNNAPGTSGSGVFTASAAVTVTSSIIAQNAGNDDLFAGNGATVGGNNNIIGNGDNAGSFTGANNQVGTAGSLIDPLLGALADNGGATQTHALQDGSPAIDAGTGSLATDQRGVAVSGTIDIGAFESAPVVLPEVSVTGDTNPEEGATVVNGEFGFSFSTALPEAITVNFAIGGNAGNPGDYSFDNASNNVTNFNFDAGTGTGSFTVPAGEIDATLVVVPVDDTDVDPGETIDLTINSGTGYTIDGNLNAATLTITDDEIATLPSVSVVATDATATEEDGNDTGVFTISRTGDTAGALEVTLDLDSTVADAAADGDYSLSVGGNAVTVNNNQVTVTIPDGAASVTLDVTANADDDTVSEALKFDLDTTAGTYDADGTNNTATVTLADNDVVATLPSVSVVTTDATATEGSTTDTGVFTISRTGDTTDALDVSFDIISSTQDYNLVITNQASAQLDVNQLSLTIPSGESELTITLNALEDADTDAETFTLDLVDSADYAVGTSSGGTISITDNDTPPSTGNITNNAGTFGLGGLTAGEIVNLQFNLVSKDASFNNTIGVVEVAADGSVGGVASGSAGYNDAVLQQGEIIFSALANTTNVSVDSSRIISEFASGANLRFFLIPDGDASNGLLFSSDANQLDIAESGGNFTLSWDDQVTGGDSDKNDLVVQVSSTNQQAPLGSASQGQADVLDLSSVVGQNVNVSYTISSDASFNNTVGFYRIDDLTGSIGGVSAGDTGYAQVALNNRVGDAFSVDGQTTVNVTGSGLFGLYILQNGDANTPIFSVPNANLGSADHFRSLGDNTFGVEDLLSSNPLFDGDFNDLVVSFDVQTV